MDIPTNWLWTDNQIPAGNPVSNTVVTSFEFLHLFNSVEQSAIMTAALSNATLLFNVVQAASSPTIDLSNSVVVTYVEGLQAAGLIANAAAILAGTHD